MIRIHSDSNLYEMAPCASNVINFSFSSSSVWMHQAIEWTKIRKRPMKRKKKPENIWSNHLFSRCDCSSCVPFSFVYTFSGFFFWSNFTLVFSHLAFVQQITKWFRSHKQSPVQCTLQTFGLALNSSFKH